MGLLIRNGVVYSGGANGKSAYEQAVEGGYQGTEAQFKQLLSTADTRLTDLEDDIGDISTVLASVVDVEEEEP